MITERINRRGSLESSAAGVTLVHRVDWLAQESSSFYRRVPLKMLCGFSAREGFHDG